MDEASTRRTLCLLTCLPDGVMAMTPGLPGLVETSSNLGLLETAPEALTASCCVRSSVDSRKEMVCRRMESLLSMLGGSVEIQGNYPGWAYREDSPLRALMTEVFTAQYGHPPKVDVIHAGLECGLLSAKLPGLDCVSIGPELLEIHTPRERMSIASVERLWRFLTQVLRQAR